MERIVSKWKYKNEFGTVGNRTSKQIQKEIDYLYQLDKTISNRVRASYSIPQKLSKSLKDIQI
tara:strand:+ start:811 stop:999 length:189 start_codon:yes stop_codon:yes gene_type:complete